MTDRLPLAQLESYLWGAATILRGLIDAGDYTPYRHKSRFTHIDPEQAF
ncbi:hypothetical protein [Thiocystis violacea]|nr:hypothetical protein [Thiocystis violacea]